MSDDAQVGASTRISPNSLANLTRRWKPGESGNRAGRPKSPVDIAALARVHGPRCIQVAVELLDSPDDRVRLAALIALLDRGFGRPKQAATVDVDGPPTLQAQHLLAATTVGAQMIAELKQREAMMNGAPTISGSAEPIAVAPPIIDLNSPPPIE